MEKLTPLHFYRIALFTSSVFIVGILWRSPVYVFVLLSILFIELSRTLKWRYIKTGLLCMVLGPVAEAIAIAFVTWNYSNYQLVGVPLWLAPLWGIAALFFISMAVFVGESPQR